MNHAQKDLEARVGQKDIQVSVTHLGACEKCLVRIFIDCSLQPYFL